MSFWFSRITLTRPHSHIAQNMAEHRLWMFDVDVDDGFIIPSSGSMTGRSAQFFLRDGIKRRRRHVLMEPLHSAFGSLADGSILRHSAAGLQLASCMKVSNSRHCQRRHRAHSLLPSSPFASHLTSWGLLLTGLSISYDRKPRCAEPLTPWKAQPLLIGLLTS